MNKKLIDRVDAEIELLRRELDGNACIRMGIVEVGRHRYLGVIVPGLRVDPGQFSGAKAVNALLLLSSGYPTIPPVGIYLDRPYELRDNTHFVHDGYHGAPSLHQRGWYWYCFAYGGFDRSAAAQLWRPKGRPGDGHNLATVVAAARISLNP